MTDHEPWPLLAALDELLARERWLEDKDTIFAMCRRIIMETHISPVRFHGFSTGYKTTWHLEYDFLRSRDAAAILEEALGIWPYPDDTPGLPERCPIAFRHWHWWWWDGEESRPIDPKNEAAYRTRAALEAGWLAGLWPVKEDR